MRPRLVTLAVLFASLFACGTVFGQSDFDAEVKDISLSPSDVHAGQTADVRVKVKNLSDEDNGYDGAATFDIRIIIESPDGDRKSISFNDEEFSHLESRYLEWIDYTFDNSGNYNITGEVYDIDGKESNWDSGHRFDALSEEFEIPNDPPVADHESPSDPSIEVTASESKQFTVEATDPNGNLQSVDWQIERPGEEWEYTGDSDGISGSYDEATHTASFEETGEHRVKALVYDTEDEVDWAIWTAEVTPQTGDLTVTVENVDGSSSPYPGSNGTVVLYDADWNEISTKGTDSDGQVTFSDVPTGSDYKLEAYHDGSRPDPFEREFWGAITGVSVQSGSNSLTFTRNAPWVSGVDITDASTGEDVYGGTVEAGTELQVELTLTNPDERGAFDRQAKGHVLLDRDESASFDFNEVSDYQSVDRNGTASGTGTRKRPGGNGSVLSSNSSSRDNSPSESRRFLARSGLVDVPNVCMERGPQ